MNLFSLTKEDLEENADKAKIIVLQSLVKEGFLSNDVADEWGKSHTIIFRKKGIFRTLSKVWDKTEESDKYQYLIVKKIDIPENDNNETKKD